MIRTILDLQVDGADRERLLGWISAYRLGIWHWLYRTERLRQLVRAEIRERWAGAGTPEATPAARAGFLERW